MQAQFKPEETLYRAVKPTRIYWKEDGSVSSAAFKDSVGASVDRLGDREEPEAIATLCQNMPDPTSGIISITYQNCQDVNATVKYLPTNTNPYHSEIHGSDTSVKLTNGQRKKLIKHAVIKLRPANLNC